MSKNILKRLTLIIPALALTLACLAGSAFGPKTPQAWASTATERFKDTTDGLPTASIQTVSAFDLNDAKVVGGSAKKSGPLRNTTVTYSPDRKFRLIQGERMFVEYAYGDPIFYAIGKYNKLPGSITLQWDRAAVDNTTGRVLDVQLTISDINLRLVSFRGSGYAPTINGGCPAVTLLANRTIAGDSSIQDMHKASAIDPKKWYKDEGFSSLAVVTADRCRDYQATSYGNYTVRFLNRDGTENKGRFNMIVTDIDMPGQYKFDGAWEEDYSRRDKSQEHIKLLTEGDRLYLTEHTVLYTDEDSYVPKEAWSEEETDGDDVKSWALARIRSGSTFELGSSGTMNLFSQLDPVFSALDVSIKGNGLGSGHTFEAGTSVQFAYKIENVGVKTVWLRKRVDSLGFFDCPKQSLAPEESMTCYNRGTLHP